jgi:YVTN family beta-propeller protein
MGEKVVKSFWSFAAAASVLFFKSPTAATAGQVPFAASAADIPISHRDRVYSAEQFSNTVSVVDPVDNRLVGVIRLGEPQPGNLSPLYRGQVLVHGMGFSPDRRTVAVVSIGSNAVTFIDTATNRVEHTTYVGRSPHEPFFSQDGTELWVTVRGENYVSVIDTKTYKEKLRITVPNGPGMQIFSPDGKYGYICSSFTPETVVVNVANHRIVGHVPQVSPFCPNIAATPDGKQVWLTLKDSGKVEVFHARPPFEVLKTIDTGPITNHVTIVRNARGSFAYVTVGGLNEVRVFRTNNFASVATISTGDLPHGIWPSGDGSRVYVGLEGGDGLSAIDTVTNKVLATVPIGQAPQAVNYVPGAVVADAVMQPTASLGLAGEASRLVLLSQSGASTGLKAPTIVSLYDQGFTQVLEAAATSLAPRSPYVLALSNQPDGSGVLQPLAAFVTNPAGSAVVNAVGPIREIVSPHKGAQRRYLVIVPGTATHFGAPVQVEAANELDTRELRMPRRCERP